jgi:hypothetical protein
MFNKHKEINYGVKILAKALLWQDFTNDIKFTRTARIRKHMLGVKKPKRSDMDKFKPYENQTTHFIS